MISNSARAVMLGTTVAVSLQAATQAAAQDASRPNVVILYYDDLGYSDVGYADTSQTSMTPRLDQLASEGMVFTQGYSSDAVCTPSRYSMLTGRYSWRTAIQRGVTQGYSAPIMDADRFTIGSMIVVVT